MQVNISEPCHENWQDFTPTQRGAFCQKCAVDVIDFSNKTADEVKLTLLENSGKNICGRFKANQLKDLSQDYKNWENQTSRTFQSKFLWACILVFGMTLFTGCNSTQAQDIINNTIKTELISDPTDPDSLKNSTPKQVHLLGKIAYTPDPVDDYDYIKGDIETNIKCTANDSTKTNLETTDSTEIGIEPMLLGEIVPPEYFDSFLKDTVDLGTSNTNKLNNDSTVEINKEPILEVKNKIVGELYPNPTNNRSWLVFTPVEIGLHEVIVYSIDGKKLFTAFRGKLKKEQQRIGISLSEYETGIYIVKITAKNSDCSLKMNKVR